MARVAAANHSPVSALREAGMPRNDEATFVIHGLDVDNRIVRADAFVRKLQVLLAALRSADKSVNNRGSFIYMMSSLAQGSASVTIREKPKYRGQPAQSGIDALERAANAIYNGDSQIDRISAPLVFQVRNLGRGVGKAFSHAELAFPASNVIRIDDFLASQSDIAVRNLTAPSGSQTQLFYHGLASGSFDGTLKEIDARGVMLRGKLMLSAGGLEIDCVMNKERIPEAIEGFDKRVLLDGMAHYDGQSQIPIRIDVHSIQIVGVRQSLTRWRGAFAPLQREYAEEDW